MPWSAFLPTNQGISQNEDDFSDSELAHDGGAFSQNHEGVCADEVGFSQAPEADEFEAMLFSQDG
jgi:hypothetical protein